MKIVACNMPGIGFGNKMSINAFGYIISHITGKEFIPIPMKEYENTQLQNIPCTRCFGNPLLTSAFGDQYVNLEKILNHPGDIIINSYVQKAEYYVQHRDILKEFFKESQQDTQGGRDLTLYIRNGDYKDLDWYLGVDTYKMMLSLIKFDALDIVVEHIDSDINVLQEKYEANIQSGTIMDDFLFLCNSNRILMSQSTFVWWAAFLGKAQSVYFPLTQAGKRGIWLEAPGQDDIDLFFEFNKNHKILI